MAAVRATSCKSDGGGRSCTLTLVTPATENEIHQDALVALAPAEGRTMSIKPAFGKVCLSQAASCPERTASQKQSRPQGLHLAPLISFQTLAPPVSSLSLSFPIWKGVIPGLTALQSSCEFCDIRAHECGTTLKSYKSTRRRRKKKVRQCLLRIWFPYCLRHFALGEQPRLGDDCLVPGLGLRVPSGEKNV